MSEKSITCINGQFVLPSEATISVADRGFRFGDGVFETIRLVDGVPYQWETHLARLNAGLAALRITAPNVDWLAVATALITRNLSASLRGAVGDAAIQTQVDSSAADAARWIAMASPRNDILSGFLRIAVSRGVGSRGYMPNADIQPTWAMEILPATALPKRPFTLWHSTITRPPLSALPANHKLAHGIGSTLALMEARDHGCDEALMLTHDGKISECASGNLFWISGDKIFTPALSTACLAGTTRAAILRLSSAPIEEVVADMSSLASADAAFISNARLGVWPIIRLAPNKKQFDVTHPFIREISARLDADRAAYVTTHRHQWMSA